jgi:hypothetical protein
MGVKLVTMSKEIQFYDGIHNVEEVAVTTVIYNRETLLPVKYDFESDALSHDKLQRTEYLNLDENILFRNCETVWDIEDKVEGFWNRLNDLDSGWTPRDIVKVLRVERV